MNKRILFLLLFLLFLPGLAFGDVDNRKTQSKLSFDFVDADIRNILRVLAEVSGKNIIISDEAKGRVTIKVDNVTWEEALDVILKNNDLAKVEDENIIRIVTLKRFFDERDRERKERTEFLREKEAKQRLEEDFVIETIFINYANAVEIEKIVRGETIVQAGAAGAARVYRGLLSPNGTVVLNKWNNALVIKDTRENVEQIRLRIREQDYPPPQVQIEARIVEANSEFLDELGVKWKATYTSKSGNIIEGRVDESVIAPAGALRVLIGSPTSSFQLDATLSALEREGKGRIISSPKVVASDNQTAKISQGQQIPYQTVTMAGATPTTQFIDAVLSLEVTPHVTKDGNINLKIKATKDRPTIITGATQPGIDKKEATTNMILRDGETTVLGGVFESENQGVDEGIPILRHIPLIGWLFKYQRKSDTKRELVIFVTPTIIKNKYTEVGG
jgi:type IV pilus assembly protein PilQ